MKAVTKMQAACLHSPAFSTSTLCPASPRAYSKSEETTSAVSHILLQVTQPQITWQLHHIRAFEHCSMRVRPVPLLPDQDRDSPLKPQTWRRSTWKVRHGQAGRRLRIREVQTRKQLRDPREKQQAGGRGGAASDRLQEDGGLV